VAGRPERILLLETEKDVAAVPGSEDTGVVILDELALMRLPVLRVVGTTATTATPVAGCSGTETAPGGPAGFRCLLFHYSPRRVSVLFLSSTATSRLS
jgi:hypothetical protein